MNFVKRAGMRSIWAGSSVLALLAPQGIAYAQTVSASQPLAPADEGVIVVTAQKRGENLSDVPISISVLAGEQLDRSTGGGVAETLARVPGVAINDSQGGTSIAIRGVSGAIIGSNPNAFYLDSAPFGLARLSITPDTDVYDLERIEVLRGPQGTLYGANALNGVVRILTHDPVFGQFDVKSRGLVSATEGGDANYRFDAALNMPLGDRVAIRGVVGYKDFSGWIDSPNQNNVNDETSTTYRFKLKAEPTNALSLGLSVWDSKIKYGGQVFSREDDTITALRDQPVEIGFTAYEAELRYDFQAFTVTSNTSYLKYNSFSTVDLAVPVAIPLPLFSGSYSKVFAEELLLSSANATGFRWTLGAFYRDAKDTRIQYLFDAPGTVPISDFTDKSKSFAIFGEITYPLLTELDITAGFRYFHDNSTSDGHLSGSSSSSKSEKVTPRVVLTWSPGGDQLFYASYAQGFRNGFPQNESVFVEFPDAPPVGPDTLTNYELGSKGNLLGGILSYEIAAYYIDWQEIQRVSALIVNGLPAAFPSNAGSASGPGVDVSLALRPVENLQIGAAFSWNDLTFDQDVNDGSRVTNLAGDRIAGSPKYTASGFVNLSFPMGEGITGNFSGSINYHSKLQTSATEFPTTLGSVDSILTGDASFRLDFLAHWSATLFVNNIGNERGANWTQLVPEWSVRSRPRTIGLQLEYHFQ